VQRTPSDALPHGNPRPPAHETPAERWKRRAVSVPLVLLVTAVLCAALPVLLALGLIFDLVGRTRLGMSRLILMLTAVFIGQTGVIVSCAWLWLRFVGDDETRRDAWTAAHFGVQRVYSQWLLWNASHILGLRFEVSGLECLEPQGPLLVMVRHASVGDQMLPTNYIGVQRGVLLRYVGKRSLLWDPVLDLVGHRIPNVFVRRGSTDPKREIGYLLGLMEDLRAGDGVGLYPEGTRWSLSRRRQILEKLRAAGDDRMAEFAEKLRCTLPPKLGGVLALLDRNERADVVFCAHTGFESVRHLADLWRGRVVGKTVRVHFWRCAWRDVPRERGERVAWFLEQWRELDAWIDAHMPDTDRVLLGLSTADSDAAG
jgi:1-acyl-sn-glycerol-3-phosphate acyltransferase